jgi:phosphoglycerate-specific signal transduction histidine kinase
MVRMADALSQPLTAASNYIGAARLYLQSTETNANNLAAENLEYAEVQIIRAGATVRQFRDRRLD